MRNLFLFFLLLSVYGFSCSSTIHRIFGKKTPHEEYAEKLDDRGLDKTPEGRAWLAASKSAFATALTVSLPYRQQGYFHPDKPRALGLQFTAKAGERLLFTLNRKGAALPIYADLFKSTDNASPVLSADTTNFAYDVDEGGTYVLRLQPELFRSGEYSLSISLAPSLYFPVSYSKASIASVWGDNRDGGKRSHEGIDIFAPRLTPAVAAADGYVTGVREGGLGGKTVWLRPAGKSYTLYYAHLDQQLVQEGQAVKKGDVVGLVGNTGNAKNTPSHLHFGVYTAGGAIDPLPFVNRTVKSAPAFGDKNLHNGLRLTKAQKDANGTTIKTATPLIPLAADAKGYLAELPDGQQVQLPYSAVKEAREPVGKAERMTAVQSEKGQNAAPGF